MRSQAEPGNEQQPTILTDEHDISILDIPSSSLQNQAFEVHSSVATC